MGQNNVFENKAKYLKINAFDVKKYLLFGNAPDGS